MFSLYVQCFFVALLGMVFAIVLKMRSTDLKARAANVPFDWVQFIKEDWLSHVLSVLTIAIAMFFLQDAISLYPRAVYYMKAIFATVGYTGSDIMSKLFSAANKRLTTIIDEKTNRADGV